MAESWVCAVDGKDNKNYFHVYKRQKDVFVDSGGIKYVIAHEDSSSLTLNKYHGTYGLSLVMINKESKYFIYGMIGHTDTGLKKGYFPVLINGNCEVTE